MKKAGSSRKSKREPIKFIGNECRPMSPELQARWNSLMNELVEKHGPAMLEYARKQQLEEQQQNNPA